MSSDSGDKRSVSTDALETLGTIIDDRAGRDAIHIAVEPVVAAEELPPSARVGRYPDGTFGLGAGKQLGIVDPYLGKDVQPGQRFWLLLFPRQITSLRHVWAHPDFPEAAPPASEGDRAATVNAIAATKESLAYLQDYAGDVGVSYQTLMETIQYYLDERVSGKPYFGDIPCIGFGVEIERRDVPAEFWRHYERVSGVTVDPFWKTEETYFRCAC